MRHSHQPALSLFRIPLFLFAASLLLATQPQAISATRTWTNTNGFTGTWNRSGNWSPNAIPTSGDTAVINNGGTAFITGVSGTYTTLTIGTLSGSSGNLSISGGSLNALGSGPSSTLGVAAGATGRATVTGGTWNAGFFVAGNSGTGTVNLIGGTLNSEDSSSIGNNAGGAGTVTVSGGTWSNAGNLQIGSRGTGTLTIIDSGVVTLGSGTAFITDSVSGGAGTLNLGSGTTAGTLTASTVMGRSGTAVVNFNQSGSYSFAPKLSGTMTVNAIGTGTTRLMGDNSYTGNTIVANGMLIILGDDSGVSGTTSVQSGATLGGTGTMGGDVLVQAGGTLAPGQSPGLLSFTGALTMSATATLEMQFTGTGAGLYDQIFVDGNFAAGGTLNLDVSYAASSGDTFQIFTSGGFDSGSFTILSNLSGGLTWDDSQLASTGVVSIIPEPATLGLLALGSLLNLRRRRRE